MNLRLKRTLLWGGGVLGALLLLLVALVAWLLFTTAGARWVAGLVTSRFAPQVKYASIDGSIAGALTVTDFRFEGPPDAARIRIAKMTVEPTLMMVFSRTLRIENARVEGLLVTLPEQARPEDDEDGPLWVEPPLDVIVDDFALVDGRIVKGAEQLFAVKQLGIAARWRRDELLIERLSLLPGDIAGSLDVKGRVTPSGKLVRGEIDARWRDVVIPEKLAGRVIATQGAVHFDGTPEKYLVKGELDAGPPGEPTHVVLDAAGTDSALALHRMDLTQRAGSLALRGMLQFQPGIGWDLEAQARDFDPGKLAAGWPGRVNLDAATIGKMSDAGPSGTLRIDRLSGELRGRPIAGSGQLAMSAPSQVSGNLELRSGRSRVAVKGEAAEHIDAVVDISFASLNDWVPDTQGSLTGSFRVRGTWPKLTIAGTADGKGLGFGENRVARLHVDATVDTPLDPTGKLRVAAQEVSAAGFLFAEVTMDASGNQAKHRVAVDAQGEKLDAGVTVSGGLAQGAWRGELSRLDLNAPDMAKLALRAPAKVSYGGGVFDIAQTCLTDADSSLCVAVRAEQSGALKAGYSFEKVPLALANSLAPDLLPGQLRGELAGQGDIRRTADGQWFGAARVRSPSAHIVLLESDAALGQRTLLLYENLDLNARLEGTKANGTFTAGLQNGGSLRAKLGVTNLAAEAPALSGTVNASMPTLAPFGAFLPTVANLDGAVVAEVTIGGTVRAPQISGNVDATKLQADLGALGIELRDGRMRGEALQTKGGGGGGFTLAGSVASGKGHIELEGTMSARGEVDARIRGQNFLAANIPAANVVVTPALTLTGNQKGYLLGGELAIPRAEINLQNLPQDEPPGVSPDVVVVRNGKEEVREQEASALPVSANVTVILGEQIKVAGYGLDATVTGRLTVRESPGAPTTGSGTLEVAGRYKAYGQDLTIKDGKLLFAGTPLDNPRLAIIAMREIDDDLSTGLRIAGTAQRPIITVVSDPNVGEADALSYLVTGRSLNDVGSASGSSQDALASATRSLEGAGAGLVAKRIGARLGLDEATVEENDMIGGSALTIGEYLSPRLYLSYGVGLFEPGEVIALRYKLSDDVGVKVQRGSEETRAGVEYRIEK